MNKLFNRFAAAVTCKSFQVKQSLAELKNDERGLSGVVVAVLLILVAVLAVVMIWKLLGNYIQEVWKRVTDADTIGK